MDLDADLMTRPLDAAELTRFASLQAGLPELWREIHGSESCAHTSVVIPSISFDREELAKIDGVACYEERLLFALMRLRHPSARVLYVTSQPVDPAIVDYYLGLLSGVPANHARKRLGLFHLSDGSATPLSARLLERPRLLARMRAWIGDPERAYLSCFVSTRLEQRLALALGVPLNACDPDLAGWGTKSGSRSAFARAGVPYPPGREGVRTRADVVSALVELTRGPRPARKAVVKLDASFSGEGNAVMRMPDPLPEDEASLRAELTARLEHLAWTAPDETPARYFAKLEQMGGVVEAFVEAETPRSPSVQLRITPTGDVQVVSTHDQILGGATGQVYMGCRFPADAAYRRLIQDQALAIGAVLRDLGVVSRFGVDFVVAQDAAGAWSAHAIEINLRMGGTTHPFLGLQLLTGGAVDPDTGEFVTPRGERRCYVATDSLKAEAYRGLLPEDLLDIAVEEHLVFEHAHEKGTVFHMIGALSRYGKVGVTCIGATPEEAERIFDDTVAALDRATGASQGRGGRRGRLLDRRPVVLE